MFKFITKIIAGKVIKKLLSILLLLVIGYITYATFFKKEPPRVAPKTGWFSWVPGVGKVEEPKGLVEGTVDTVTNTISNISATTTNLVKTTWNAILPGEEEKPKGFFDKSFAKIRYDVKNTVYDTANTVTSYRYIFGSLLYVAALVKLYNMEEMPTFASGVSYAACASVAAALYSLTIFVLNEQLFTGFLSANVLSVVAISQLGLYTFILYGTAALCVFDVALLGIYLKIYATRAAKLTKG